MKRPDAARCEPRAVSRVRMSERVSLAGSMDDVAWLRRTQGQGKRAPGTVYSLARRARPLYTDGCRVAILSQRDRGT